MRSLARRQIEHTIRQANKQIRSTKKSLNRPEAKGLVLLVNEGNYFAHPAEALYLISRVMQDHFLESAIDGVVYFTVNMAAKRPDNDRELSFWVPMYRGEAGDLADFVNHLGSEWGAFHAKVAGQEMPRFQSDDLRMILPMRLVRTPRSR
jgi:hypothetical protein